jgi:hypothetical protein
MMTCIAVQCFHCHSDQIVKRGKTARGTPSFPARLPQPRLLAQGEIVSIRRHGAAA